MSSKVFDIENFNILSDEENYYFFRALNSGDNKDIEDQIIIDENNEIHEIRTDRERYQGEAKYNETDNVSLEEVFEHIKMKHRTDTNCISLTSNANVAALYGRGNYKDNYIMVKVPKKELGKKVINAASYMIDEIEKRIDEYINNNEIDEVTKYYLDAIDYAKNEEHLESIMERRKEKLEEEEDRFERGIVYGTNTTSIDYGALNKKQNFEKNKLIAKLDVLEQDILPNRKNKFLIQTLGSAFSSLELIHYNNIEKEEIIEAPKEMIDIFSLVQQIPEDYPKVKELKQELIKSVKDKKVTNNKFSYGNSELTKEEYTIEKMYNLTNGNVDFIDALGIYKKSFYLAKSKLRTIHTAKEITNIINSNEYEEIINYIKNNTFGVEPEVFSKASSNKLKVSESVNLDFKPKEIELFNFINNLKEEELVNIVNNPLESLKNLLIKYPEFRSEKISKELYYANAIIDSFNWSSLDIVEFSPRRRNMIIEKLLEYDIVNIYNELKEKRIPEEKISNLLLTTIINDRSLTEEEIMNNKTFTREQLEDFLGFYQIKGTKQLKLRGYQGTALKNINRNLKNNDFTAAVLPTGAGKSFIALSKMLDYKDEEILYLAPNEEILNQIERYILKYIYTKELDSDVVKDLENKELTEDLTKKEKDLIKEVFPKLNLATYQKISGINRDKIAKEKYDLIVLDELHRTGAIEWEKHIESLLENQLKDTSKKTKVLGITATPERDWDKQNMASKWANFYGYTKEDITLHKHLSANMDLEEAINREYVVNPKVVSCMYQQIKESKELDNIKEAMEEEKDLVKKRKYEQTYQQMRRKVDKAENIEQILGKNVEKGKKYIVFCPVINEDEDGYSEKTYENRLIGQDALEQNQEKIKKLLAKYYETTEEKIESMTQFNSMLGSYSKKQNNDELEEFERNDENKIKFMTVMNKLNEGVHMEGVDGIIWLRPLSEDAKILFLQQFGRIIYGLNPEEILPDEKRPVVIDLADNVYNVRLDKTENQTNDLDKMVFITDWIEEHDNKIPNINSNDKEERKNAESLKNIKDKYIKYLEKDNLNYLHENKRIEIEEIFNLGKNIDLWNYEFPEKIKIEHDINNTDKEEIGLFSIVGELKDYIEMKEDIITVTSKEKKEELIKSIRELGRLPKKRRDGESERVFRDETDQRNYHDVLQKKYKKIDFSKELTEREKQIIKDYEEINDVLKEYNVIVTSEEKKEELIKSIRELGRLPKKRRDGESERVFRDETDQRNYHDDLQKKYKKIDFSKELTEIEKQIIKDYEEINDVLKEYNVIVTDQEKKEEIIKSIKELGRLPKQRSNNKGESERVFRDGTDQRNYHDVLEQKYKKIDFSKELTEIEKQIIKDYEEINDVLKEYNVIVTDQEKKEEIIKSIKELGRLPKVKRSENDGSERVFRNGKDQRHYYDYLQKSYKKIYSNNELTDREKQIIKDYEEINDVLKEYIVIVTSEEKKEELIKSIWELGRLPKVKSDNNDESERVFRDETDQRSYYNELQKSYKKIYSNNELTEREKQIIKDYEEINELLKEYNVIVTSEEKKEEIIKSIRELGRLPKIRNNNKGESERVFRNEKDQRNYYNNLKQAYKKINFSKELTEKEKQIVKDYEEINNVLKEYGFKQKVTEIRNIKDELINQENTASENSKKL